MKFVHSLVGFCAAGLLVSPASAVSIVLDYSHAGTSFFDTGTMEGQMARAAVEKAAFDISGALTTVLGGIPTNVFTGSEGSSSVTFTTLLNYQNPDSGASVELNPFSFAQNEFRIFLGARVLAGDTLGQGGPANVSISISGGGQGATWEAAVAEADAAANASLNRGDANLIYDSESGTLTVQGVPASFDVGFAPTVGNLWFDLDRGAGPAWHLDHTVPVPMGTVDLYSVAAHEMLHSLGYGIGEMWTKNVSGTSWTGSEVQAYLGTDGSDVVNGGHVEDGITGFAIVDGEITATVQESAMTDSIAAGERRYLTDFDLAVLRDMGFTTIPEPSVLVLLAFGSAGLLRRRRAA